MIIAVFGLKSSKITQLICSFPFFHRVLPPIELALKDCSDVQKVGFSQLQKKEKYIIFGNDYILSQKFEFVRTNHLSLHLGTVIATIVIECIDS